MYNAFILPAFNYCSDVWHFCNKRSNDKLEQLNKQALRTVKPLDNGHLSDVM